jgi:NADH-quinone oxidoreductase subunit H
VSFVVILALVLWGVLQVLFLSWLERKVVGRIQDRYGPNRAGPWGIIQAVADAIKMFTKEDVVPAAADRWVHLLAPAVVLVPSFLLLAVIPFTRGFAGVDLNIGILYVISISSLGTIAILMAGWSSNNKYSLLGGMRVAAQLISYEVPMSLSIIVAVMLSGSLSLTEITQAQAGWFGLRWHVFFFPVGTLAFIIYFISAVAELNRAPFDIPEADSEIVAGFFTEYSGMKFALFFLAEYVNAFALAAIASTLFLGGWQGPILPPWFWFLAKTYGLIVVLMWLRGTLPRVRVDQLMGLAWKVLVPLALVNILLAGAGVSALQALGYG